MSMKGEWSTDDSSTEESDLLAQKSFRTIQQRVIPDSDESEDEDDSNARSEGIISETDDEDEDILSVSMQKTNLSKTQHGIIPDTPPSKGGSAKNSPISKNSSIKNDSIQSTSSSTSEKCSPISRNSSVKNKSSGSETDLQVIDNSNSANDIVEVSSSESDDIVIVPVKEESGIEASIQTITNKRKVDYNEYQKQQERVRDLTRQCWQVENTKRTVNLNTLPDKGKMILERQKILEQMLEKAKSVFAGMELMTQPQIVNGALIKPPIVTWEDIQAGAKVIQPQTFGKKGIEKFEAQKAMSLERLQLLHGSLKNCPSENDLAENPEYLKIDLMPHQKRALKWLIWRENSKPSGGILADDMGLGKTLTMISLILATMEMEDNDDDDDESEEDEEQNDEVAKKCDYQGGTLVVCPASIINQWVEEIRNRTKRGSLSVELHHGAKRETRAKPLARADIVITTYSLAKNEVKLYKRIKWRRIILDEAHQIRNYKSQTACAIYELPAKSRWALTGTPINNKELDLYSLLKFLRCSPFDNLSVWKHWVANKSTGGQERLNTVISSLMLRRTKAELIDRGALNSMPEKKWELVRVNLDPGETKVYQKVLTFSKTLLAQFLHQRAEKNTTLNNFGNPNKEYNKMIEKFRKMNKYKEIKQHEILVLLLRLRQICCHPYLISQMLQGDEDLGNAESADEIEELDLIEQLNKLDLDEDQTESLPIVNTDEAVSLKEASRGILNLSNPVFSPKTRTSKLKKCFELLDKILESDDKVIIVSQWSSLLNLIGDHLKAEKIKYDQLDGKIPVNKRQPIVENFNNQRHPVKILLLSLTAGGVGLNLIGGNHLILLDLHWNPQLERQAQDRIYRVGQKKPVFIYKILMENTIEERIYALQQNKLELAESITQGSKTSGVNKLTLQDLKMLFDM